MGLIACFTCGREISAAASACPHCGQPGRRSGNGYLTGGTVVGVTGFVLFLIGGGVLAMGLSSASGAAETVQTIGGAVMAVSLVPMLLAATLRAVGHHKAKAAAR